MYSATGIHGKLRRLRTRLNKPGFRVLFGDQAFPTSDHCYKILANADEIWKRSYNRCIFKMRISALLWNCHNSVNGGQTSAYLNVAPMSIGDFLGNRTGTMPVFVQVCRLW